MVGADDEGEGMGTAGRGCGSMGVITRGEGSVGKGWLRAGVRAGLRAGEEATIAGDRGIREVIFFFLST